jgi:hypothetical protein
MAAGYPALKTHVDLGHTIPPVGTLWDLL